MKNDGKKKNSNYNKKYTGNKKRKMDYLSQVTKDIKLDWKSEKKFVDYLYTETGALYQTPNIYTLNTVVTGPEWFNRIGRKINMLSLRLRIQFAIDPGVVTESQSARIARYLIVYDRQSDNLPPVLDDVLLGTNYNGTQNNLRGFAFPNISNSERFIILRDRCISIAQNGNLLEPYNISMIDGKQDKTWFEEYVKLKGLTTVYGNNDPSLIAINTGALYLMVFSNFIGVETSNIKSQFTARLKFMDN